MAADARGHHLAPADAFGAAMRAAMEAMDRGMNAARMSGDPDQDFLAMMIPHHQGAIDMARLVLVHGRDPHVRQLAGEIIAAQQAEIDAMHVRLAILRRGGDAGEYPALGGTRGPVR